MLIRLIFLLLGTFLIGLSITFTIIYLNLLKLGYTFLEYVNFIIRRCECLIFILGILLVHFSLRKER